MATDHTICCGGASGAALPPTKRPPLSLRAWGPQANIQLQIEDVLNGLWGEIPDLFLDLLDVAAYIYAADQAVARGSEKDENFGEQWRRRLHFAVAVRLPEVWNSPCVSEELTAALSFLSEDEYHFHFESLLDPPRFENYLQFRPDRFSGTVEEVLLFSGGLDSLAGVVKQAVTQRRQLVLVHHRSNPKLAPVVGGLARELAARAPGRTPMLLPVSVNKDSRLTRETTQRTRSFLFATLGAAVAFMLGLDRVHFYENGVVSLNLPPSAQVVGARATRTTHPRVLAGFTRLFSLLAGRPFTVANPFQWMTKTQVVQLLTAGACEDLIGRSRSCAHPQASSNARPHCGVCSQCIDRRFAVLAAGLEWHDPEDGYLVDLLRGPRKPGHPQTMLAVYAETANQIERMTAPAFFARYGEVSRVLADPADPPTAVAQRVFQLYQSHAVDVGRVIDQGVARYAADIRRRTLPKTCLLEMVRDRGEVESALPAPVVDLAENVLRRCGEAWQVRFAGGQAWTLLASKGAAYLHLLLRQPGKSMRVVDLAYAVVKDPRLFALGGADPILDEESRTTCWAKLQELNADIESAKQEGNEILLGELEAEKAQLIQQLAKATGMGRRPRRLGDPLEKVRKAVLMALTRTLQKIGEYDKELRAHLKPPTLRRGDNPCYDPRTPVAWYT